MRAPLLALAVLVAAGRDTRAGTDPCAPAAVDRTLGARTVEIGTDGALAATQGSAFPAVSEDGATVVQVFADAIDFVGTPVGTLVFFTKRGSIASFQIEGRLSDDPAPDPSVVASDAHTLSAANARLATTRWRALPVVTECADDHSLHFAGGFRVSYEPTTARLTSTLRGKTRPLRGTFPPPGATMEKDLPPTCGGVTSLEQGFGSRALGFAVLQPRAQLGGDSCMAKLGVELAIVVRL